MAGFIAILGSLDTKGLEISYLCARVIAEGGQPLVIDTGVLGEPSLQAEISRHEVTPGEILQEYVGAPCSAGPDRMKAAGRLGVPQVFAPGGLDFIIEGPLVKYHCKMEWQEGDAAYAEH